MAFKLFGREFGKPEPAPQALFMETSNPTDGPVDFSTFSTWSPDSLLNRDNNPDLSSPVVKEIYTTGGMVNFGIDNLEPNRISKLYYTSPLNRSIIQFKKSMVTGGGFEYENPPITTDEKLNLYKFENSIKLNRSYKQIAESIIIHSRACIELLFDNEGKYIKGNWIDPIKVRNGQRNQHGEIDMYYFSQDYELTRGAQVEIPAYRPGSKAKRQLYVYQIDSPGMNIYSLAPWVTAANEIWLAGNLTYMRKSYMVNSINPAFYLNFPVRLNEKGQNELKKSLQQGKGAGNNGKTLVFQSNSAEQMPTIGNIPTSNNDKLFTTTYDQTNEIICMAHCINPGIMGFKVNSSLGNGDELKTSYNIFKSTIIADLKCEVENVVNDIMFIANVPSKFKLNDFNPSGDFVMSGLATEMNAKEDFTTADQQIAPEIKTNEAVRNLTAKQHQQLLRIIRQYGKDQITYEAAAVLLKNGLGFTDEDVDALLGETE